MRLNCQGLINQHSNKYILNIDHFKNRNTLNIISDEADNYQMEPFPRGWAHCWQRGTIIFRYPRRKRDKQFIIKMPEKLTKTQSKDQGNPKSNRGRKHGNSEVIWHTILKEILEQSL